MRVSRDEMMRPSQCWELQKTIRAVVGGQNGHRMGGAGEDGDGGPAHRAEQVNELFVVLFERAAEGNLALLQTRKEYEMCVER